jgi:hypothetical protein
MSASSLRARRAALVVALLLLLAPRAGLACSVCTGGERPDVGRAFLRGSLVLSMLPLAAAGGLAFWLRRRSRELARDGAVRERPAAASRPA